MPLNDPAPIIEAPPLPETRPYRDPPTGPQEAIATIEGIPGIPGMTDLPELPRVIRNWTWPKLLWESLRHFLAHEGTMRAAALTYGGFLATVPITILLSFFAWKYDFLSLLFEWVQQWDVKFHLQLPLDRILPVLDHARSLKPGTLGWMGTGALLVTFWFTFANIEAALNAFWGIRRKRPFLKTLVVYFPFLGIISGSFLLLALFLNNFRVVSKMLLGGTIVRDLGDTLNIGGALVFLGGAIWVMVTLIYWLLPNTRVLKAAAFTAGTVATGLILAFLFVAAKFQAYLFVRYSVVYGSLAILPLLLVGNYAFWTILLLGNSLCSRLQKHLKE
jgi:membrane protein